MNWTNAKELHAQLQKLWDKGELLASLVTGEALFPKRLSLKIPSSGEISLHFDEVRCWIADLRALSHYRLEMRAFKHRQFGDNLLPQEIWLDHIEDALALLGKQRDAARFQTLIGLTRQQQPQLLNWLAKRPLRALELAEQWPRLLSVVGWMKTHPRPDMYLRQIDLAGVDSKFIESHLGTLSELLDLTLPAEAIDTSASGTSQFARRYGYADKPLRLRFRLLDAAHALFPVITQQDITLDAESFAQLGAALCGIKRVFITENEINFLAFPQVKDSLVIFGAGYGFDALGKAHWLARCRLYYWGDIDTHGFAILDQLRDQFAQVKSLLMDRATLLAHEAHWGNEAQATCRDLPRLTQDESTLYNTLRDQRLGKNLRLEQERISFQRLIAALKQLSSET
ncbi:MAG: DUF2220 family protein [Burkholderiaceae bacterium]|nr:DUF2220 family protein [Burkholderiaceae bacterium]